MKCAIIGAGLSALTCAGELRAASHDVVLFDKGRYAGGRMSTRRFQTRFGEVGLDHGAPCFDALGSDFRIAVAAWRRDGIVARWPAGGSDAWLGVPDMATLIAHLAVSHEVKWHTFVDGVMRSPRGDWLISTDRGFHGPFDTVITAVPPEQAVHFLALHDLEMARTVSAVRSRACWAGLFVFERALSVAPLVFRNIGPIALAVCNRGKPLRATPESWVLHADSEWSEARIEQNPEDITAQLLSALKNALGLRDLPPHEAVAHRWRHALSAGLGKTALWNTDLKLGVCGDWLLGPRAECAWISGRALGRLVNATFSDLSTMSQEDSLCAS